MCWSIEASAALAGAGVAVAAVTYRRGEPPALWGTMLYFSLMETLQVAGYLVIDDCGSAPNEAVTFLSYLHIAFQPLVINWFALELVPEPIRQRARTVVLSLCGVAVAVMLAQIVPWEPLGRCIPGRPLCGEAYCTVSGNWHIAWNIPYNGLMNPVESIMGTRSGFPVYMVAVFVLPLFYGAWRLVLVNALAGPFLATVLTDNPNEMPAVWCLFSIAILCIGLSPVVRRRVATRTWWGYRVEPAGG